MMKIYIQRHDGYITVKKRIKKHPHNRNDIYRKIKTVKDTPANLADILRWADALGYDVEEL